MSDVFVSLSDFCVDGVEIGDAQLIKEHADRSNTKHVKINMVKLQQKYEIVNGKIEGVLQNLVRLKEVIEDASRILLKELSQISKKMVGKIEEVMKQMWSPEFELQYERSMVRQKMRRKAFKQMTCKQMKKVVHFLQTIEKDADFENVQKEKKSKIYNDLISQFDNGVKSKMQKIFAEFYRVLADKKKIVFGDSFSTIQQNSIFEDNSGYSFLKQIQQTEENTILEIEKSVEMQTDFMKKKKKYIPVLQAANTTNNYSKMLQTDSSKGGKQEDSLFMKYPTKEKQQSNNVGNLSNEISNASGDKSSELSSFLKSSYFDQQQQIKQDTKSITSVGSAKLVSKVPYQQQQISSQDSDKLNQTLLQIEQQIFNRCGDESMEESWSTIQQLARKVSEQIRFDTRVKIVKVLYYSVLQKHIPKIKFVGADHTGFAVFFTNYCPGMKVDTQLELTECKFHIYRGSAQIVNNQNFRIMGKQEAKIVANTKGVKLNKVLTFDLHYPIRDQRCSLIRQIAEQLKKIRVVKINRMTVEIVSISNKWSHGVFCLVGDSSGMMMAYVKKGILKVLRQGVVVRLINVKGERGFEKNKQMSQQIIYIDTYGEQSKVLPHKFDFLQLCSDVMYA